MPNGSCHKQQPCAYLIGNTLYVILLKGFIFWFLVNSQVSPWGIWSLSRLAQLFPSETRSITAESSPPPTGQSPSVSWSAARICPSRRVRGTCRRANLWVWPEMHFPVVGFGQSTLFRNFPTSAAARDVRRCRIHNRVTRGLHACQGFSTKASIRDRKSTCIAVETVGIKQILNSIWAWTSNILPTELFVPVSPRPPQNNCAFEKCRRGFGAQDGDSALKQQWHREKEVPICQAAFWNMLFIDFFPQKGFSYLYPEVKWKKKGGVFLLNIFFWLWNAGDSHWVVAPSCVWLRTLGSKTRVESWLVACTKVHNCSREIVCSLVGNRRICSLRYISVKIILLSWLWKWY